MLGGCGTRRERGEGLPCAHQLALHAYRTCTHAAQPERGRRPPCLPAFRSMRIHACMHALASPFCGCPCVMALNTPAYSFPRVMLHLQGKRHTPRPHAGGGGPPRALPRTSGAVGLAAAHAAGGRLPEAPWGGAAAGACVPGRGWGGCAMDGVQDAAEPAGGGEPRRDAGVVSMAGNIHLWHSLPGPARCIPPNHLHCPQGRAPFPPPLPRTLPHHPQTRMHATLTHTCTHHHQPP